MAAPPVPPRLLLSRPSGDVADLPILSPKRRAARPSPSDWIDIDEDAPPRNKRTAKKPSRRHYEKPLPALEQKKSYFPRLTRILEGSESTTSFKSASSIADQRRHRDRSAAGRSRLRDDSRSSVHRRPTKHRTVAVHSRRPDLFPRANSSSLSVLSSLTDTSARSSGSGSTITQSSYNKSDSPHTRTPTGPSYRTEASVVAMSGSRSRQKLPNVFDYMVEEENGRDDRSIRSSSSVSSASSTATSQYAPSDAGSSDGPGTPSSRSTMPSPTVTRNCSVSELRHSSSSVRSDSHSPDSSTRNVGKQQGMSDVAEESDDEDAFDAAPPSPKRRSSSRSSQCSDDPRVRQQDELRRQHMAYATHAQSGAQYVDQVYGQHRSPSASSASSDRAAYLAHQMAMQQYHASSPPPPGSIIPGAAPILPQALNAHMADRPPVPDAPDLSQRTLIGYEQLALELASTASPVKPIYRKFEYLNHRILLHLQDELSELEEQLRTVDEIIAQLEPTSSDPTGRRSPSSRRGDTYNGVEIHHRRTSLLGRIFLKTEQYSRAMKAYADMTRDSTSASAEQVKTYQSWLTQHSPVHELETRFLHQTRDLILPGAPSTRAAAATTSMSNSSSSMSKWQAGCALLPFALMLPLLLFSAIPNVIGRLLVTSLIAIGAFIVAATNARLRALVSVREWAVAGGMYVLVMAAVAGCVPVH